MLRLRACWSDSPLSAQYQRLGVWRLVRRRCMCPPALSGSLDSVWIPRTSP